MFTETDRRWGHNDLRRAEAVRAKDVGALTDEHIDIFAYFHSEKTAIELRKARYKALYDPPLTPEQQAQKEIDAKQAPAITARPAKAIPKFIAGRDRSKDGRITQNFTKQCETQEQADRLLALQAEFFHVLEAMDFTDKIALNHKEAVDRLITRIDALEKVVRDGQPPEKSSSKPRIKYRGTWSPTTPYNQGDAVVHRGKLYGFAFKHMTFTPYPDDPVSFDTWIPIESPRAVA